MGGFVIQRGLVEIPLTDQHVQHRVVLGNCGITEFLHRTRQQAQLLTQLHMTVFEVAGRRRHVVRVDGGQRIRTPILRRTEHAVHLFEPFHRATEDAVPGQRFGNVRRHHAEVLAHHDAAGAGSLHREDAEHDFGIVMHVGAIHGLPAFRNPPQAEQSEDVVDAHGPRIGEHAMDHVAVRLVAGTLQLDGVQRRLAPVLPLLVEHVRRRADRGALGETLGVPPYVRSRGMHADGHVRDDADLHAGGAGRALRGMQLLVGDPFQPTIEFERIRILRAQLLDFRGITVVFAFPIIRIVLRRAPLVVAQAPCGVRLDLPAARIKVLVEPRLTVRSATGFEDDPQRLDLRVPHRVTVDAARIAVQRGDLVMQRVDPGAVVHRQQHVFRQGLGTDVREVDEAAGNR